MINSINKIENFQTESGLDFELAKEVDHNENLTQNLIVSSGPGQAESSGFSLSSTDEMVNKFTGDFSYSLPVMDVEGYPIVISYNSNVTMMSEASWVGLGWDLNVGAVSREMRGVPDDFNGRDEIIRTYNQRDDVTDGTKGGLYIGLDTKFGSNQKIIYKPSLQLTYLIGGYTNSYVGYGSTFDFGLQLAFSISDHKNNAQGNNLQEGGVFGLTKLGLGYSKDSKAGISINRTFGFNGGYSPQTKDETFGRSFDVSFGSSFNSRHGMLEKSLSMNVSRSGEMKTNSDNDPKWSFGESGYTGTSTVTYGTATSIPRVMINTKGYSSHMSYDAFMGYSVGNWSARLGGKYQEFEVFSTETPISPSNQIIQPAVGYLHSGKRLSVSHSTRFPVMDFDRSTETEYSVEMKNLPFSVQTYDIFYVNGLGMNATFRAGRTDFGTYYDPTIKNQTNEELVDENDDTYDVKSLTAGVTLGAGVTLTAGGGLGVQTGEVESKVWEELNTVRFEDQNTAPINKFDNTTYFKAVGETTPTDMAAWNYAGGSLADNFDVNKVDKEIKLSSYLKENDVIINGTDLNQQNQRPIEANCFVPKIAEEITGLSNYSLKSFPTQGSLSSPQAIDRISSIRKANHISAVEVVSKDGMQYTYGLPVYSISNSEVSFASGIKDNVGDTGPALGYNSFLGVVSYTAGQDNSVNNTRGRSHHFDKTTMPAFAHSFLLTQMTSADYVDRGNDGPSLDDIGSYYKFNYTQKYNVTTPYNWRFPFGGNVNDAPVASQNRGFLGTELDDVASYTFGTKEIWYTHSVESKNQIAFFYLSNRDDAYGVLGENGNIKVDMPLMKLDSIVLYNLSDYKINGSNAIPLNIVEFEYDYSLCLYMPSNKNTYIPGNDSKSGKLTLKKIRSYSGRSREEGLQVFSFEYSIPDDDAYRPMDMDAWGNLKENSGSKPNDIFPYAIQDEATANANASAWKLKSIKNPQGGQIDIDYEADRYGFVQNKRAMRHFNVHRMTSLIEFLMLQDKTVWNGVDNASTNFRNTALTADNLESLFSSNGYSTPNISLLKLRLFHFGFGMDYIGKYGHFEDNLVPNNVIIFKLDTPLSNLSREDAHKKIKELYFKSKEGDEYLKSIYFKYLVNVKTGVQELISTFARLTDDQINPFNSALPFQDDFKAVGVMPPNSSGQYEYGYVVLEPHNTGNFETKDGNDKDYRGLCINPLQHAALQFVRQNLPDKIYGTCVDCDSDLQIDKRTLYGRDVFKYMIRDAGYVSEIIPQTSVIRLFEPDSIKFGGNARVKQIKFKDNWKIASSEYSSEYSWNYEYSAPNMETGVAAFEVTGISDENPLYSWDTYINLAKKFPDESKFNTTPITAALFPKPVVGYEKVKVSFSGGQSQGYSLAHFHTAKNPDYLTIERKTALEKSESVNKLSPLKAFLGESYSLFGLTQGYEVETNDFHGKPDQLEIYNKHGVVQIRTKYHYYGLNDKIPMLDRKGILSNETVATEYDIHVDSRLIKDETHFYLGGLSISYTIGAPFPMISPFLQQQNRLQSFYSNCLIKHINRSAIVKSIETEYLSSVNKAENLVYDKFSGNVIVSSLNDEFDDKLYSVQYPSHWYYEELCSVCPSTTFNPTGTFTASVFNLTSPPSGTDLSDYYSPGDLVLFSQVGSSTTFTGQIILVNNTSLNIINADGTPFLSGGSNSYVISLVHSNRDNRLGETMQNVVTKKEISLSSTTNFEFPTQEIISSGVLTYRNKLNVRCGTPQGRTNEVEENDVINPFNYGAVGDLVTETQYSWQDERVNSTHAHGVRFDGTYSTYVPYYALNGTDKEWYKISHLNHPNNIVGNPEQKWREMARVKMFDEYGKPLEVEDQLNVRSAVLYGYSNSLNLVPTAQAVNARKQEIAFDGFEDYSYHSASLPPTVSSTHFDFKNSLNTNIVLSTTQRHSGLNSLLIPAGDSASVTRPIAIGCTTDGGGMKATEFVTDDCTCITMFQPTPNKEYVIGAWINQSGSNGVVKVTLLNGTTPVSTFNFSPSGTIIDGWQRVEGTFTIPASGCNNIRITLKNPNSSLVYFDDVRIHPFLAGMTTTVYDPKSLLPIATHDGYNFSTYYNYDENLNLVRVRVETSEGVKTISESEFGGLKDYKQ